MDGALGLSVSAFLFVDEVDEVINGVGESLVTVFILFMSMTLSVLGCATCFNFCLIVESLMPGCSVRFG